MMIFVEHALHFHTLFRGHWQTVAITLQDLAAPVPVAAQEPHGFEPGQQGHSRAGRSVKL